MSTSAPDNWHAKPAEEVMRELGTNPEGLSPAEAAERLEQYGPNVISGEEQTNWLMSFLDEFRSPLIYILFAAAAISFALGEFIDGAVILVIVFFNAIIGFAQEYRAEQALAALKKLAAPTAQVVRAADELAVPSQEVVPGDIVRVTAGNSVPADGRLIEAVRMKVEEAALTGESVPVDKDTHPVPRDVGMTDRSNMIFAGTTVASGRGTAVVTATGLNTVMGHIAQQVEATPNVETPIQRKLGQLGNLLGLVGTAIAAFLVVVGLLRGFTLFTVFLTAVALAVAFIPEGLPALVTIVLAIGVQRMARRRAIIRTLPSVETLGSTTVICTDKTGTLTQNEMTVRTGLTPEARFSITGEGYRPEGEFIVDETPADPREIPGLIRMLTAATLANDSQLIEEDGQWMVTGDPTEGALVVAARKAGLQKVDLEERHPRIDEIPFDSDYKYMATLNRSEGGNTIYVKGAPEVVLGMCAMDDEDRNAVEEANHRLAQQAYRVLAIASKDAPEGREELDRADVESGLTFLGLMGMIDPPRPEVFEAVGKARQAGIRVIMITGDNPDTASAIARELGIDAPCGPDQPLPSPPRHGEGVPGQTPHHGEGVSGQTPRPGEGAAGAPCDGEAVCSVSDAARGAAPSPWRGGLGRGPSIEACYESVTGRELERMSDEELERRIGNIAVFARVDPEHKLRIVQALKKQGWIVAMTGDGVNDAPALKRADIGISMGITGTDVARESSDMVLADDNFATIIAAVEEGRTIFANLRKVVQYLLATNTGEVLTFIAAILAGLPLPLLPVQILWVNLVTDGFATAPLSVEPKEGDVLAHPPRDPNEPVVTRHAIWRLAMIALIMTAGTVGIFFYSLRADNIVTARTMAFATLAVFQLFNAFNARSATQSIFRLGLLSNPYVLLGVGASFILQVLVIQIPVFEVIFQTRALALHEWGLVILISSSVLIIEEVRKAFAPQLFEG